jgi:NAD(P)-dependent dehydrogenase (short-subunit alcohol dehydrogenase family)
MAARAPTSAGFGPSIPVGRMAEPAEIAAVAAFLASDESRYMTGETVNINGGALTV